MRRRRNRTYVAGYWNLLVKTGGVIMTHTWVSFISHPGEDRSPSPGFHPLDYAYRTQHTPLFEVAKKAGFRALWARQHHSRQQHVVCTSLTLPYPSRGAGDEKLVENEPPSWCRHQSSSSTQIKHAACTQSPPLIAAGRLDVYHRHISDFWRS